jgi:hypothetical protein
MFSWWSGSSGRAPASSNTSATKKKKVQICTLNYKILKEIEGLNKWKDIPCSCIGNLLLLRRQ